MTYEGGYLPPEQYAQWQARTAKENAAREAFMTERAARLDGTPSVDWQSVQTLASGLDRAIARLTALENRIVALEARKK